MGARSKADSEWTHIALTGLTPYRGRQKGQGGLDSHLQMPAPDQMLERLLWSRRAIVAREGVKGHAVAWTAELTAYVSFSNGSRIARVTSECASHCCGQPARP